MRTLALLTALIVAVVGLDTAIKHGAVQDVSMFVVGAVYQTFVPDPPPYEYVDQLAAQSPRRGSPRLVRLHGYAVSVERSANRAHFKLERNGRSVRVSYSGPMPAGLIEGNEVVATGALSDGAELHATQLTARVGG